MAKKTCFIKQDGKYVEMLYATFLELCEISEEYSAKWLIPLHGYLMEVEESDYKDFYKTVRRSKYIEEEAILHGEVSYNALDTDELMGEETLKDDCEPFDDIVVRRLMVDRLRECLLLLNAVEMELITELYFNGKSERKLSAETDIPRKTINDRKQRILVKLGKLINS